MAAWRKEPVILIISVGEEWQQGLLDDPTGWGAGLEELGKHAYLKRVRTVDDALDSLSKNAASPPDGILVTDTGVSLDEGKLLLQRLVAYARAGGTVVMSYSFSSNMRMDELASFWKLAWGLDWAPASYQRADYLLNDSASTLKAGSVPVDKLYSQKALCLKNVPREYCWYLKPTLDPATSSELFPPDPVSDVETPVAFAPVGQGKIGYTGDVNMEAGTYKVVKRMLGI